MNYGYYVFEAEYSIGGYRDKDVMIKKVKFLANGQHGAEEISRDLGLDISSLRKVPQLYKQEKKHEEIRR